MFNAVLIDKSPVSCHAAQLHRSVSTLLWILIAFAVSGCATTREGSHALYSVDRAEDYPVRIVSASFAPSIDIDIALLGKSHGALRGAGRGVLECSPSLAAGPIGPFIFVPCAVLSGLVGGAVGAWSTAPKTESESLGEAFGSGHGSAIQQSLADKAHIYLADVTESAVDRAGEGVVGPRSSKDRPEYRPSVSAAGGSILELSLLEIHYKGSGLNNAPVCLRMVARGRKIDAATGKVIDELDYSHIIECLTVTQWLKEGGVRFSTALEDGARILVEGLVDELYLIYYPPRHAQSLTTSERPVPEYVLSPITPRAPEMYLDFRPITKQPEHIIGFGGMHFVDVDSLTPHLAWEIFPRQFDTLAGENHFADVSYDVRIYSGREHSRQVIIPSTLVHEVKGLVQAYYFVETRLQPCSHYFWTVRARFTLNGIRRVTEWSGAYVTLGGEISPSYIRRGGKLGFPDHALYYPFRTPGPDGSAACWK